MAAQLGRVSQAEGGEDGARIGAVAVRATDAQVNTQYILRRRPLAVNGGTVGVTGPIPDLDPD